jgi:hypothetical protein
VNTDKKNIVAFGFNTLVTNPSRNAAKKVVLVVVATSESDSLFERRSWYAI